MEFWQHIAGAVALRLLMAGTGWSDVFMDRVDLATPLTSLRRLREGLFYYRRHLFPYAGAALFHALLASADIVDVLLSLPGH
jgi:hypothetical protein